MLLRIAIVAAFAGVTSGAAVAQTTALPADGDLIEHYEPAARISGTTLAGVVTSLDGTPLPDLSASIPQIWAGSRICARLVSIDGRYEARREYIVPANWGGGQALLPFPTGHRDVVDGLGIERLGVLVSRGDCAGQSEDMEVVIGGWNAAPGRGGDVTLLVNSFRSDETYLYLGSGQQIACIELPDDQRIAFDVKCVVPSADVSTPVLAIEINRIKNGDVVPGGGLIELATGG